MTATGTQIELITDAPSLNGDALLVLGEEASNNLNSTYEEFCPDGLDSPDCEVSLEACMNVDQKVIEKRIVPVVALAAVGAVAAAGMAINYAQMRQHENAISRMRITSANVEKLVAVKSSSTVVLATQTSGGNLLTVVPNPTGGYVYIS